MIVVPRIELLDVVRGIALVAMTVFHFAFDLELYGFQEPGFISQPHWKYFARAIASTFLILVGISLFLAHCNGVNWAGWWPRMLKIIGAACLITVATWFATPDQYIFFGILHAIAFASLAGLLFLHLPAAVLLAIAITIFLTGQLVETTVLDPRIFAWTGLPAEEIRSSDFVPVFPWFSAPLLGIAVARYAADKNLLSKWAQYKTSSAPMRLMKFLGRNSLVYYLLHQPVMISLILGWKFISGT